MVSIFSHPAYLIPPLFGVMVTIVLLVFVFAKGKTDERRRVFIGLLISLALWCLFSFNMRSSTDVKSAGFWERAMIVSALAMFVFYYHFTLTYIEKLRNRRAVLILIYSFLGIFTFVLETTDLILKGVSAEPYGYAPITGPFGIPVFAAGPLLIVLGIANLISAYRHSTSYEERNRLLYLTLAGVFPVAGAGLDGFTHLPPMSIWANIIFCVICSVAILKYNLLDIKLIIRKSMAYLLVSAAIALPYAVSMILANRLLTSRTDPWWMHVFFILMLAIFLHPLYGRARELVDRIFYRDRYDYLRALEKFSSEAQSIIELKKLSRAIVDLVVGALRVSNACLLLASEKKGGLSIAASSGPMEMLEEPVIRSNSILIKYLNRHKRSLSIQDFDVSPQLQSLALRERSNLSSLKAELLVPIIRRGKKISGILVLGTKESALSYSTEDRQLLSTASTQLAMAVENAQLYENTVRAKENLEASLNSMSDSVVIVSSDLRLEFLNNAARERFGNLLPGGNKGPLGKLDGYIKSAISNYRHGVKEADAVADSIGGREYEIISTPLLNAYGEVSVISVLRDVTMRKQMEKEKQDLEQKAQINSRLLTVGQMASGIAHEINNPLTAVIGYAQLLQDQDVPSEIKEDLDRIMDGSKRVAGIINRLLTFARQKKPERKLVNVNEIILNTVELCAYNLRTAGIDVCPRFQAELVETVADSGQLQQLFLNIIINAEKELRFRQGKKIISISTEQTEDIIRITFSDTGPGIPKEYIGRVFDPFFTTRRAGEGTGLGLSVCHGIVAEHNGRIYATSEEGQGASFIIELPIIQAGAEASKELPEIEEHQDGENEVKILVVDDEPSVRGVLEKTLNKLGYQVETVDNPFDALIRIKQSSYNVILLDVKMPGMSGIELYRYIDETAGSLKNRIIIITGDVMGSETKEFLTETKVRFITKPFDMTNLRGNIREILSSNV